MGEASNKNRESFLDDGYNAMFAGDLAALSEFANGDLALMNVISLGSGSYETEHGTQFVPYFKVAKITHKGSCE